MNIKVKDISIEKVLEGAEYLGCGASKEAYLKDGIVYKIPRGRYLIQKGGFGVNLNYPDTMKEVDEFLDEVDSYEPALVWPLGQFAIELIVWESIQTLRADGLDINGFAEIKDYYVDRDGIIVIEQEATKQFYMDTDEDRILFDKLYEEIDSLEIVLRERFDIQLRDIRDANCGIADNGKLKLFDFGISTTTKLDCYGSYSEYEDEEEEYSNGSSYED